jgi:hypothetical protein
MAGSFSALAAWPASRGRTDTALPPQEAFDNPPGRGEHEPSGDQLAILILDEEVHAVTGAPMAAPFWSHATAADAAPVAAEMDEREEHGEHVGARPLSSALQ